MKNQQLVRLKFIDAMFHEHGRLKRSFLVELFDISEITATRDLRLYEELQGYIYYDRSEKIFKSAVGYQPVAALWEDQSPEAFLAALKVVFNVDIGNIPVVQVGVKKRSV